MFGALSEKDLHIVIDAMDERNCSPGEVVITEGEPGDVLYIVESGELICLKLIDGEQK
jgi:cAMP-dependent protein kinase regulator